jgi:hypothetical protein
MSSTRQQSRCDLIPGIDASIGDAEPHDDHTILWEDGDQLPKVTMRR